MERLPALALAIICGALVSGCATTAATSCRPGESSVTCCIKKHPLSPAESCAASQKEILAALMALEAAAHIEADDADDFANNAGLPEWKQRCIKGYVDCENKGWTGSCQHDWPTSLCGPQRKRR